MYTPNEQKPGAGKTDDRSQANARPETDPAKQVRPEDVIQAPASPTRANDPSKPPLQAATGNDDVMSEPPQKTS